MKLNHLKLSLLFFIGNWGAIQAQDALNVTLSYQDFIDTLRVNYRDSYYSECWGFTQNQGDYAVISSTAGAHIYDITEPENSYHAAFIKSQANGYNANWRDYHDYNGYLYMVNDGIDGTLQIADLQYLPDSVSIVYDKSDLIKQAHNIFIDTAKARLYICGGSDNFDQPINLGIYDISTPSKPELLKKYDQFGFVHDCFVRNDTAYLQSPDEQILRIVDFSDFDNPQILGSLTDYPTAGYTHAGWLTDDGQHYILTDETYHSDLKMCDVSDLTDIKVIDEFSSEISDSSMVHNPIIRGNLVYVSHYNDGLQIFDISDPRDVIRVGYYDTYNGPKSGGYRGAWGVYPFENGKVVISDRQTGLYVLDASGLIELDTAVEPSVNFENFELYPNPVVDEFTIKVKPGVFNLLRLYSIKSELIFNFKISVTDEFINKSLPEDLSGGVYGLFLYSGEQSTKRQIFYERLVIVED